MDIYHNIPILLVAVPILFSALTIFLRSTFRLQKILNATVFAGLFAMSLALLLYVWENGIIVYEVGEWGKYGIILVADLLGSGMVVLSSFISLMAMLYAHDYMHKDTALDTTFFPLFNIMVAGLNGIFLTGDLFNLFVFFEVLVMASCGLIVLTGRGDHTKMVAKVEAIFKYLILNMFSIILMLTAIASLYATVGTLNMADISVKLSYLSENGTLPWHIHVIALMFIVVFGYKAAMFPLHFWLADVHPSAPAPIHAMLSGMVIKVGVYAMLRVHYLLFPDVLFLTRPILIVLSLITIVVGATSAIGQYDLKRMLAYSSVSQIGYVLLGVGMGTAYTTTAALVYLVNHAMAKSMLFLTTGETLYHAGTKDIRKMGGFIRTAPFLGGVFLMGSMSIAGLPPMGGFIAKLVLFDAGLGAGFYIPIAIALVFAIFTLFYLFRTWLTIFWGEFKEPENEELYLSRNPTTQIKIALMLLACAVLFFGVYPEPLLALSTEITSQLFDPQPYIDAVLGGSVR
ncbi:proton-conducting transporter membrane subunit [Methanolobus sp. ZRKC3]|uniref:proton-conducting transporter transmembrane domain-containing protein n=1 Tax=Methanolobus sp. ZRKC3 TaxID=3125786 RepID=UPI00325584A2